MTGPSQELLPLFQTLVEIVASLRGPQGCPWDKEQTDRSLTQYAIEEAFELVEAIEGGDPVEVQEELGDFLFQVILHAQVAQDEGRFELKDVVARLNEKMVRRHPHVFGEADLRNVQEVWKNWDKIKAVEKKDKPAQIFSYPRNMPALQAAGKIGRKTEGWKFDWQTPEEVLAKVREELEEVEAALQEFREKYPNGGVAPKDPGREALEHEIGDLLFSTAQLSRHLGMDAEANLREANRRFENRFRKVVALSGLDKEAFSALPDARKEELWRRVKKDEK